MSRTVRNMIAVAAVTAILVAPATVWAIDRFTDVPDSNVFHDDITWLANAGVTLGCNPPSNTRYCPSDTVTREQMAAFMRRLAENQVVDAATVEGFSGAELGSRATFAAATGVITSTTPSLEATIDAPAPGVLIINGTVDVTYNGTDTTVSCSLAVDGAIVPGSDMYASVASTVAEDICGTTGGMNVESGVHTVSLDIDNFDAASLYDRSLTATWVPFDGNGLIPSGAESIPLEPSAKATD